MSPHKDEESPKVADEIKTSDVQNKAAPKIQALRFSGPPKFDDPYEERDYLKGRLAAAFRIFGKYGFDEGVAGHITVRVSHYLAHCVGWGVHVCNVPRVWDGGLEGT